MANKIDTSIQSIAALEQQLNASKLSSTNNPLYLTIKGLINTMQTTHKIVSNLVNTTNTSSGGTPGPPGPPGINGFIGSGIDGLDGLDGFDGILQLIGVGPVGPAGPSGPQGLAGIFGLDGFDGIDGLDGVPGSSGSVAGAIDYSLGTYTPSDGSGAALTFTGVSGNFIKIAKLVWFTANFTYPTTASGTVAKVALSPFVSGVSEKTALSIGFQSGGAQLFTSYIPNNGNGFEFAIPVTGAFATNADCSGVAFAVSGTFQSLA